MGKFRKILMKLSIRDTPIFSFLDDNLSKYQRILTKLGTCIDIKDVWFEIADELSARDIIMTGYYRFTFLFLLEQGSNLKPSASKSSALTTRPPSHDAVLFCCFNKSIKLEISKDIK